MILVPLNLSDIPLLVVVWAIDAYCFAVLLRAVVAQFATHGSPAIVLAHLRGLTDGLPAQARALLQNYRHRSCPAWLSWLVVLAMLSIIRLVLLGLLGRAAQ